MSIRMLLLGRATLVLLVVLTSSVAFVSVAAADLQIEAFDARVERADGSLETQAGAHPYQAVADFTLNANASGLGPQETIKTVVVDLPAGFVGNPQAVGQCARAKFLAFVTGAAGCSPDTQVGEITITDLGYGAPNPQTYAVFNLVPGKQDVADFGFLVGGVPTHLIPRVRSGGDYGVSIDVSRISQEIPAWASRVVFWGQPADASHDARRSCDGSQQNLGCASSGAPRPFLTNPSVCGPRFDTVIRMDSWQEPGDFKTAIATTPTPATGCEKLNFAPTVTVRPDSSTAGIPSGYAIDVAVPQNDNPNGLGTPPLKDAVVTLPVGVRISPSSAEGLGGCSDEQIGLRSLDAPACPEASKIGSLTVDTPVLDEPLTGDIYLGQPKSNDSQSGDMFRIFLTAAARGVQIKLEGKIVPDPVTGQLKTTFSDNPQLPFDKLTVRFKGGPRAPLTNPSSCGTHTTTAALTPWSSTTPVTVTSPIVIDRGCESAGAFAPTLSAGSTNPVAGASSSFALDLARPDGQQDIAGLDAVLPAGLLGSIAGVAQCPEAQAAAGTCDAASQIGRVAAASGAGANPLWVPQPGKAPTAVYLAGPYKGAPFSLSIVVPAQAGPFDLGTVVVRAALFIDPLDAHVTARADPLPTILSGVPLQIGRIVVTIDRAGFMRNPTSCARKTINGVATSVAGATAAVASRFQVGDCSALALKPSLALSLSGKGQTTDGKHPAVTAVVSQPAGQANLKKVRVALPLSLALDTDNANGLCEFVDGSKVTPTCPKASIVGTATATTPILDEPLTGPVYFVKNVRKDPKSGRDIRTLPKLVIPMVGQNGVKLTLTGTSDVEDDQLVTTFDNIPDAPVSSFKLSINGGKGGILAISGDKADICKATQIAEQQVDGHNNRQADTDVYIQTPSCPTKIISKTIGKSTVKLKIGGLGAGKVTVTGRGIKKTTKTISKSTVATITAKRTGRAKPGAFKVKFTKAKVAKAIA